MVLSGKKKKKDNAKKPKPKHNKIKNYLSVSEQEVFVPQESLFQGDVSSGVSETPFLSLFGLFIRNWVEETKQLAITLAGDSEIAEANNVWTDASGRDELSVNGVTTRSDTRLWREWDSLMGRETESATRQQQRRAVWCHSLTRRRDPWVHKRGAGTKERRWFLCAGHFQERYWISAPSSDAHTLRRALEDGKGKEKSKNDAKICLTGRRLRSIF